MGSSAVLIISSSDDIRKPLVDAISGYDIETVGSKDEAAAKLKRMFFKVVFFELTGSSKENYLAVKELREYFPDTGVVLICEARTPCEVERLRKLGAYDCLKIPIDPSMVMNILERYRTRMLLKKELNYLKEELNKHKTKVEIISCSKNMKKVFELIRMVSKASSGVLISGESGTGKELVARNIHDLSSRLGMPFVEVNCGAVPAELIESELFGHEKGSFTGANTQKIGKFELADGGTLFLDEVGSIPINLQVKLLRALQERIIQRVGGTKDIAVDIRVIAATNSNLEEEIKKGNFREDLYYRLKVVPIELPPLRERIDDMELLIEWFLETHSKECRKKILGISTEAINALKGYAWPGNVRELENMIERLVVLAPNNSEITLKDLPAEISAVRVDRRRYPVDGIDYKAALRQFEEKYIGAVLNEVAWNKGEAAKHMKVHRNTLLNKIRSLGLSKARAKEKPKL